LVVLHTGFALDLLSTLASQNLGKSLDQLYLEFLSKQRAILISVIIIMPAMLYNLLRFSHRLAGPLSRCRTILEMMAGREPVPEFKPRKNDLMRGLFEAFNAHIKDWNLLVAPGEDAPREQSGQGEQRELAHTG
jgi:hypothetical protein